MSNKVRHGWFSIKSYNQGGYWVYGTPDGKTVQVTLVNDSATEHQTGWDDMVYVGEVVYVGEMTEHIRHFPMTRIDIDYSDCNEYE